MNKKDQEQIQGTSLVSFAPLFWQAWSTQKEAQSLHNDFQGTLGLGPITSRPHRPPRPPCNPVFTASVVYTRKESEGFYRMEVLSSCAQL